MRNYKLWRRIRKKGTLMKMKSEDLNKLYTYVEFFAVYMFPIMKTLGIM